MSYVRYLKQRHKKETVQVDPEDISPIVDRFRSLVKEHNIPLQIYFEEKKTWGVPVVSQGGFWLTLECSSLYFDRFPQNQRQLGSGMNLPQPVSSEHTKRW
jgi:hypothetical protein